jgi:hypothetical protein
MRLKKRAYTNNTSRTAAPAVMARARRPGAWLDDVSKNMTLTAVELPTALQLRGSNELEPLVSQLLSPGETLLEVVGTRGE